MIDLSYFTRSVGIYRLKSPHKFRKIDHHIPSQVDVSVRSYMSGHILHVYPAQSQTLSVLEQQYQLYLSMKNNPQFAQHQDYSNMACTSDGSLRIFMGFFLPQTSCTSSVVTRIGPRDQRTILMDDAHPEGENSVKRQKTSEYEAYMSGESSSGKVNEEE
ncbi:hypothetical protein Tco_1059499 [Tanacetum coccineum]